MGQKETPTMNLKHMIAVTGVGLSTTLAPVFAHAADKTPTTVHTKPTAKKAHKPHKKTAQARHKSAPKSQS